MNIEDFNYTLPDSLIAQKPLENRDKSRLMLLSKKTGETGHETFCNIIHYLDAGDCLVLYDTRVIPARLFGVKEGSGGHIEFLLLKRHEKDLWEVMLRPGKRAKIGSRFIFGDILTATGRILFTTETGWLNSNMKAF